jgi:hypothetical protein
MYSSLEEGSFGTVEAGIKDHSNMTAVISFSNA